MTLPEIAISRLPAPAVTEAVFGLYRELFGEAEVDVVRTAFAGEETEFSRDWIACAFMENGALAGTAMGTQTRDIPTLGALNGVGVRPEARGQKLAERCCRSILETLDGAGVRGTFLATGNPVAAHLYGKLGFAFLPGTSVMLRCRESGDDAYAFFRDFYPGGATGEVLPGDASCRLPLIPLVLSSHRRGLDPLLSLWGIPVELVNSQGLYPRCEALVRRGGSWFQLRGAQRELAAIGTTLPENETELWINVTAHPKYCEAEEKMWRFLLEYCREKQASPLVPVPEALADRRAFLESAGLTSRGKRVYTHKNLQIEYCLYGN